VASQILALAASITVARLLGSAVFGEFGMIRSTAMTFGSLATFGLGLTATKHVAELRTGDPERAGRIIILSGLFAACTGVLMAIVLYLAARPLAQHALGAPHLAGLVRVGSLLLALSAINAAQAGALAGFEAFRTMTKVSIVVGVISVPVLVTATYFAGLPGAIWGLIINLIVSVLLTHVALRGAAAKAGVPLRYATCLREWRVLWSFSLPTALSNLLAAPATWICHALLVNQAGGYAEMGFFNAANQWRMAILFVPQRVCMIVLPVLSSLAGEGRIREYRRTLRAGVLLSTGLATAAAVPVALLSFWIMRAYGQDFTSRSSALVLLAASAVFMSAAVVGGQAIISLGKAWYRLVVHGMWSATMLIGAGILLTGGGTATELALANVIACAAQCIAQYGFLSLAMRSLPADIQGQTETPAETSAKPKRQLAA
jgi:O-antigen/teichoic acid export membrane protein